MNTVLTVWTAKPYGIMPSNVYANPATDFLQRLIGNGLINLYTNSNIRSMTHYQYYPVLKSMATGSRTGTQ
jgi:hypothetical protein